MRFMGILDSLQTRYYPRLSRICAADRIGKRAVFRKFGYPGECNERNIR